MAMRASESIENLSDQLKGYAEEVARAVESISEQYEITREFALLIVQTGIENMKIDVEHHRNFHIELISDALSEIAAAIDSGGDIF